MRTRDVLGLLVVIAAVAGAIFLGWQWFSDTVSDDEDVVAEDAEPGEDPDATVNAYVTAWQDGDFAAMRQLVREAPEDFEDVHAQLISALSPTSMSVETEPLNMPVDGRAITTVTLTMEVEGLPEPVTWDSELELLRDRGEWGVEWDLSTIHPELRPTWQFDVVASSMERQPILAADGTPIASSDGSITFGFQPALVDNDSDVIDAFAEAIPGSEAAAERELSRDDLNDDWFYPVITVSEAAAEEAGPQLRAAAGVLQQDADGTRTLLEDGFAQHVVGVVSDATAEQLEALGDDAEVGTQVPQFGLEAALDEQLEGSDWTQVGLRDADTNGGDGDDGSAAELRVVIAEGQANPSEPVQTTLELPVQRAVEATFADLDDDMDEPVAIVVVDGDSGAISASGSRPSSGFNRAFAGRYAPGSTFKVVTTEGLLASGMTPDDQVECPGQVTIGGRTVPNAGSLELGTTTFTEVFANSCNTTFAQLGTELGSDELVETAERFGFGVEPDVPLDVFGGSFPAPEDDAEIAAAAFGQARVEVSPLHMASIAAAVTSGTWHQPYLIEPNENGQDPAADDGGGNNQDGEEQAGTGEDSAVQDGAGEADGDGASNVDREQRQLSSDVIEDLQAMMEAAVTDGTATAAQVDDETVGGKTGTAQATDDVEHAWFIGTWQNYGFAILVEDGGSGGEAAAPIGGLLVEHMAAQIAAAADADEADNGDDDADDDSDDSGDDDSNDDDSDDSNDDDSGDDEED